MRRAIVAGAGVVGSALAVHAAPACSALRVARLWWWPALAGLGNPRHVALTFDDGPDPVSTPLFLEALDRLGWHATFFLLGEMVRRSPGLAVELADAGHEVAVHADRHRSMAWRFPRDIRNDLRGATASVAEATGRVPQWFRPPYGMLSTSAILNATEIGLRTVLWTTWGRDWRPTATSASVVADVLASLTPGATVLLHDSDCMSASGSWRVTLGALPRLAEELAERGLTVGPLAEHGVERPAAAPLG